MYEMFNQVPFTSTGADGKLKLHEAVAMMMDCCQFQEYQEKAFWDFLRSNNLAVFLFSIQIDILRLPAFREKVRTAVKIYGCKSIYGLRQITMHDEEGKLCLISNATGAFFDIHAGKAIKLAPTDLGVKFDEALPMECLPRKIPVPQAEGMEKEPFTVRPSNLDFNGHLTSSVYFAISGDVLPPDYRFNRVRVEYKKQAKPGEIIHPVCYDGGNGLMVVDMKDSDGVSYALAEYSTADFSQQL